MLRLAIVGFGAMGQELVRLLQVDQHLQVSQIVVSTRATEESLRSAARMAPQARVLTAVDLSTEQRPHLLAECAGHAAVLSHVIPALQAGIPCVVASVGALHEADGFERLEAAAAQGATRVQLISGAIGAVDALAAARIGGLDRVAYVGRKPPQGWLGTPAEEVCVLAELVEPCVIFRGSAREAASRFPRNANVAATVALAGLGLDRTEVELIADPGVQCNVHQLEASGAFGHLRIEMQNLPLPDNPKTSALSAYSLARAVRNASSQVFF